MALPIALGVMDAQPIALVLALGTLIFTHTLAAIPLNTGVLVAVLVGLHWWSLYVESGGDASSRERTSAQHLAGLVVALAVVAGPYLVTFAIGYNALTGLVLAALVVGIWRRSTVRGKFQLLPEDLLGGFRLGFGVVIALVLAVAAFAGLDPLQATLAHTLPIFFLSALLALALTRLNAVRLAHQGGSGQADPGRAWLGVMLALGGILILLEGILILGVFDQVLGFFAPAWVVLVSGLKVVLALLFYPIFAFAALFVKSNGAQGIGDRRPDNKDIQPGVGNGYDTVNPLHVPPIVYDLLTVAGVILLVALLARFIIKGLLKAPRVASATADETREPVERVASTRQRGASRAARRARVALERLDAASVRARYRELLQATANDREQAHRRDETPAEYAARLQGQIAAPEASQALADLTNAYRAERYAGHPADGAQREQLRRTLPGLLARLRERR